MTRRAGGQSVQQVVASMGNYLQGWLGYYGFSEVKWEFRMLGAWLRRRLRCLIWAQWKTSQKRFKELRRRGVNCGLAKRSAGSSKGPWRMSGSRALQVALPNAYFTKLGLPPMVAHGDA